MGRRMVACALLAAMALAVAGFSGGGTSRCCGADKVYYIIGGPSPQPSRIERANLDGTSVETVMTAEAGWEFSGGIAIDDAHGHLYAGDTPSSGGGGRLFRANLDGSNRVDLITGTRVWSVQLDLVHGKVYWSGFGGTGGISRANLNGTNVETIAPSPHDYDKVTGLSLDPIGGKIYYLLGLWTPNFTDESIHYANLDGSNNSVFKSLAKGSYTTDMQIDVASGKLYWRDAGGGYLYPPRVLRTNLDGTGDVEVLYTEDALRNFAYEGISIDSASQKLYAVPDLGHDTAGDSTALHARSKKDAKAAEAEAAAGLPQPSGGKKEYTDDANKVVKVFEWFGYKLHLLVDAKHEVVLAYQVTTANAADSKSLPALVKQGQANLPEGRIHSLAYDKAADDNQSHRVLHEAKIRPVIQNRHLWKDQTEQMLPGHDGNSNIVYDEAGTVHCYDRTSLPIVRHPMAYIGYEPKRQTIKYRCPARHEGWSCPHDAVCNAGKSYGKTVRVDRTIDLRRFPPIPRATKKFERLYDGRTSVERVNARLKIFWGADDGNIRGARRFHAMVGTVLIVHLAFATLLAAAPRRDGTLGKLRLGPIQKALAGRPAA